MAQHHKGEASPDLTSPAGYVRINHFECVLDAGQHDKFRVKDVNRPPRTAHRRAAA